MVEGPLLNLEKLSEPITKLIDVVASGMGTLYAPFGTVKQAKADAEAKIIIAKAESEVASIEDRASKRLLHKESMRQENLESITSIAANELPGEVSKDPVDFDWITQYLDHAQDIRDEQLQILWARILAGEVTSPGSYSKRTLDFLKTLDKWEAVNFTEFCSFALIDSQGWRFTVHCDNYYELMKERFEGKDYEGHFSAIGLFRPDFNMATPSSLNETTFSYFGSRYIFIAQVSEFKCSK